MDAASTRWALPEKLPGRLGVAQLRVIAESALHLTLGRCGDHGSGSRGHESRTRIGKMRSLSKPRNSRVPRGFREEEAALTLVPTFDC